MKKILVGLALFFAFAVTHNASAQVTESAIRSLMEEYNVPGLTLSIVRGDSLTNLAFGYADSAGTRPVTPDTRFRIASVAKALVAGTVLSEVAAGTIRIDDDLSGLTRQSGPFRGPITLHDLLTHTAGFDERYVGYAARSSDSMIPLADYLYDRMPPRGWPVGEQISYSNHGMSLAALAVESAANYSFAEVAKSTLFEPLGMLSTSFLRKGEAIPSGAAEPLRCTEEGCESVDHIFSHAYPAGLAFSTAPDMGRFVSAVLSAEREQNPLAALIPTRFKHDERLPGISYGLFNQSYNAFKVLAHAGSVPGYWALLIIVPEKNVGFFFAANGGSSRFGEKLRDELLEDLLGPEILSFVTKSTTEDVSGRAGVYEITRYSHETIERFPQVFLNSITVTTSGDTLQVFSGGRIREYVQTDDALYENVDGSDKIAFGTRRGEPRLFRQTFVYGAGLSVAYEKRAWHRAPRFLNEYVSWLLAAPILLLFLVWPIAAAVGAFRRKRLGIEGQKHRGPSRVALIFVGVSIALFTWFGFGFVAMSNRLFDTGEMFFGVPDSLAALTWIPSLHASITLMLALGVILAWRNMWWDLFRRIVFTVAVVSIVLQVIFFINWNYLPIAW